MIFSTTALIVDRARAPDERLLLRVTFREGSTRRDRWQRFRDEYTDSIRNFWSESDLQSQKDFLLDPDGFHRCTVCTKTFRRVQDLKTHRTRQKHHEKKNTTVTKTTVKETVLKKHTEMQKDLSKVKWGELEIENS